jgi:hypothetical protein
MTKCLRSAFALLSLVSVMMAGTASAEPYPLVQDPRVLATLRYVVGVMDISDTVMIVNQGRFNPPDVPLCQTGRIEAGEHKGKIVVFASEQLLGYETRIIAAVLAHELAHVRLGHSRSDSVEVRRQQEIDADLAALKAIGPASVSAMHAKIFELPPSSLDERLAREARLAAVHDR